MQKQKSFNLFGYEFNLHNDAIQNIVKTNITVTEFEKVLEITFGSITFCPEKFAQVDQKQHDYFIKAMINLSHSGVSKYPSL